MRNIIKKIKNNLSSIDKNDFGYASIVIAIAIINLVLLVFVPITTIIQDLFILCTSGVVLFLTFDAFWGSSPDDTAYTICRCDCWVFAAFVSVILWLFPISLLWSLIPLTFAFSFSGYCNGKSRHFGETFFFAFVLFFLLSMAQSNLDAKNYLKEDPKPEIVVVDNIDLGKNVMFLNKCEESVRFYNLKTHCQAYDLDIRRGDTIQIVRHPNSPTRVIKVLK